MVAIITLFSLPVMFLNIGGGIISGIWLLILGKWSLVTGSILITVISTSFVLSLVLSPTLLLAIPTQKFLEKGNTFAAYIFVALGYIYNYAVMAIWSAGAFVFVIGSHDSGSIWPYLLLAYSVATSPWTYMASWENARGGDNLGTNIPAFFSCIGAIAMMGVVLLGNLAIENLLIAFGVVMFVSFIFQTYVFFVMARAYKDN